MTKLKIEISFSYLKNPKKNWVNLWVTDTKSHFTVTNSGHFTNYSNSQFYFTFLARNFKHKTAQGSKQNSLSPKQYCRETWDNFTFSKMSQNFLIHAVVYWGSHAYALSITSLNWPNKLIFACLCFSKLSLDMMICSISPYQGCAPKQLNADLAAQLVKSISTLTHVNNKRTKFLR